MNPSDRAARAAQTLSRTSWPSLWAQVVLGVVAAGVMLFSLPRPGIGFNPGTGAGLALSFLALGALGFSIVQRLQWLNHARRLRSSDRPSRAATIGVLRWGVMVNLTGLALGLIGSEAIAGNLLFKALSQYNLFNPLSIGAIDSSRFVQPLDIFVVLGNVHLLVAHFLGLLAGLWSIHQISQDS